MTDERITTDPPTTVAAEVDVRSRSGRTPWLVRCMSHDASPRDLANIRRSLWWTVAWVAAAVPDAEWFGATEGDTSAVSIALATAVAISVLGIVVSFARYVRETDELNRSIQFRALGVGFAAGFVTVSAGEGLERSGLVERVALDAALFAMLIAYVAAAAVITRRYR